MLGRLIFNTIPVERSTGTLLVVFFLSTKGQIFETLKRIHNEITAQWADGLKSGRQNQIDAVSENDTREELKKMNR